MRHIRLFRPVWVRRERLLDFLYLFTDFASPFIAFVLTFDSRFGSLAIRSFVESLPGVELNSTGRFFPNGHIYAWQTLLVVLAEALIFYTIYMYLDMYHGYRLLRRPRHGLRIFAVNTGMLGIVLFIRFLVRETAIPRSYFLLFAILNTVITIGLRVALRRLMRFVRHHTTRFDSPVLVIGRTPHAREIIDFIESYHPHGMHVAKVISSREARDIEDVRQILVENRVREVIVGDKSMPLDAVMDIIELTAELHNIACIVVTDRLSVLPLKAGVPVFLVRGTPCIYFDALHSVMKDTWWRRLFSRLLAAVALVLLSPVFLVIAILIKVTSPGPVFFRQDRYGINRRSFRMFKFRTMCVDAEAKLAALEKQNKMGKGGLFKVADDPRITPIGHFLRRYSLDELPQFINVFLGDMRIVGPRPLPERDLRNYYRDWHYGRHLGYPGLTCLWQVSGRSDIDFREMCVLDLYYIRNNTWALDLAILFRTVAVVFNGKGAY